MGSVGEKRERRQTKELKQQRQDLFPAFGLTCITLFSASMVTSLFVILFLPKETCPLKAFAGKQKLLYWLPSVQFSSVAQSCPTLWDPMNCSTPGLPVHHQLPEFTQTHVHRVGDAIQSSHPLSSPSPSALNPSQHQDPFKWVNSSHEVAKVLEFQLQHQSFQWTPRTDLL